MITLEELYKRTEEKKERSKLEDEQKTSTDLHFKTPQKKKSIVIENDKYRVKPRKITNYIPPKFTVPTGKSKNFNYTLRSQFSRILTFIKFNQKRRYSDACTVLYIATTSKENEMIWGYHERVSDAIEMMKKIKLIEVENPKKRFGEYESYSKTYRYYVEVEREFLEYCSKNKIEPYYPYEEEERELDANTTEILSELPANFDKSQVRFCSHVHIVKPNGISQKKFEKLLRICLYDNYPGFIDILKMKNEINKRFYSSYPDFYIRFSPSFTWGKKTKTKDERNVVVGIGIRDTTKVNNKKNKDSDERKLLLKDYGFDIEKDIKSSVPRVTIALNTGEWLDEKIDIYELIANEMNLNFTAELREAIKEFHMRVYFDERDKNEVGASVWNRMINDDLNKKDQHDVYELINKLKEAAGKVEGPFYRSEIFYVESCLYLMTLYDLLISKNENVNNGDHHLVWLLYDCFYGRGYSNKEVFERYVDQSIRYNLKVFLGWWKYKKV